MELNLSEREALYSLLPHQETFFTVKEILRIRPVLLMSAEEEKQFTIVQNGMQLFKPEAQTYLLDVPITESLTHYIRRLLQEKSIKHELLEKEFTLYEKFVEQYV